MPQRSRSKLNRRKGSSKRSNVPNVSQVTGSNLNSGVSTLESLQDSVESTLPEDCSKPVQSQTKTFVEEIYQQDVAATGSSAVDFDERDGTAPPPRKKIRKDIDMVVSVQSQGQEDNTNITLQSRGSAFGVDWSRGRKRTLSGSNRLPIKSNAPNISQPIDLSMEQERNRPFAIEVEHVVTENDISSPPKTRYPTRLFADIEVKSRMKAFVQTIDHQDAAAAGSSTICIDKRSTIPASSSKTIKTNIVNVINVQAQSKDGNTSTILHPLEPVFRIDLSRRLEPKSNTASPTNAKYPTRVFADEEVRSKMLTFIRGIDQHDVLAAGSSSVCFGVGSGVPASSPLCDNTSNTNTILPPRELLLDIDDPQEEMAVLLDGFLEADPLVVIVPQVPNEELERNRLANMERARAAAAEENRLIEEAVEQQRDRNNQIPTYLLAAVADDDVQPFVLGPFNQIPLLLETNCATQFHLLFTSGISADDQKHSK